MSWAVGYDTTWHRDIGYGVPAVCDYPDCGAAIDRGLAFVCMREPFGGEHGCGLYFCAEHLGGELAYDEDGDEVVRCTHGPECQPKDDVAEWMRHKLTDPSWQQWRDDEPDEVAFLRSALGRAS